MSSLAKLKGEGRSFWNGKAWTYPINYLLHMVVIIPTPENKEHPANFQNKSVSSPFSRVTRYILFLAKLKGRGRLFWRVQEGRPHCEITPRALDCHKTWKIIFFCEIWNNSDPPLNLLDPLTNKHCRTRSSMINLRIDSRTYHN